MKKVEAKSANMEKLLADFSEKVLSEARDIFNYSELPSVIYSINSLFEQFAKEQKESAEHSIEIADKILSNFK